MSLQADGSRASRLKDKGSDAYRILRAKLLAYGFTPYKQLNIRDLADTMGVSSTPVREALVRLADEGIITFRAGRGFFTKPLTFEEVYAEYEIEKMILLFSLAKSAKTFPAFELDTPPRFVAEQLFYGGLHNQAEEYATYLTYLHAKIALSTGNKKIHDSVSHCCDRLHHARVIDMADRQRFFSVANSVSDLVGCLMRRDLENAVLIVDACFEASISQIERVVRDGNAKAMEG